MGVVCWEGIGIGGGASALGHRWGCQEGSEGTQKGIPDFN